jgi:hypothetical protein
MTPEQDVIIDRLTGSAKIGVQWKSGPLNIAVQALRDKKLVTRGDASQALGFPSMLCYALNGASTRLTDLEDRRKFAVSFFNEVAPKAKPPRLTRQRHVEMALWVARRMHPLACSSDCPYLEHVAQLAERFVALGEVIPPADVRREEQRCSCITNRSWQGLSWEAWRSSPQGRALTALQFAGEAAAVAPYRSPNSQSNWVAREGARLAVQKEGLEGAVVFCVALARELGL